MIPLSMPDSRKLTNYIKILPNFELRDGKRYGYAHMGAIISDACLQAGLNYRTVVSPRIIHIIKHYPSATTTSGFLKTIQLHGIHKLLQWTHDEKPRRVQEMTMSFIKWGIETEDSLRQWLNKDSNLVRLQTVKGVGPKTVDYVKMLVGLPSVAVDRHMLKFAKWAGITNYEYCHIRAAFVEAASILMVQPSTLDYSIWTYMSNMQANNEA